MKIKTKAVGFRRILGSTKTVFVHPLTPIREKAAPPHQQHMYSKPDRV